MNDIKKKRKEKIVTIRWNRKSPAYIRTTLADEKAHFASDEDRLEICMIAQHVTWLQKEFDELKRNHDLLQQRFNDMNQKMNMLWMAPGMPGAIMGSQHYKDNSAKSSSSDE